MQKRSLVFILFLLMFSCKEKQLADYNVQQPLMYEPSEMALLMRQMYEVNKVTKNQLVNGKLLMAFPKDFMSIHSAVLTDPSERDAEFDSLAKVFIVHQQAAFSLQDNDSAVYHFNESVAACVTCHESRCTGPIPKIKKLQILID